MPLTLAAGGYTWRARTLAQRGRPVAGVRQAAFYGGLVAVLAALASPVAPLGEELFVWHMVQHLLLADIGALLMVVGLTGPMMAPLLRIRVVDRLRVLAHPVVALALWALNLYLWHLAPLYQGTLTSDALHALMHSCFIATGVLVWLPLFGPLPKPEWFGNVAKLLYIIGVRLTGAVLANVFLWSGEIFYPDYAPGRADWDVGGLADQSAAGGVMMVEEGILTIILFGWLFFQAARQSEEEQELLERAAAQGVELDARRVRRAVRAGRGRELAERVLDGDAAPRASS